MTRLMKLAAIALISGSCSPAIAAQPEGLTVQAGESWIFRVENGQPADARKVDANAEPAKGELKVTLDHSMGTTMLVSNKTDHWYNYQAFATAEPGSKGVRTSVCTLGAGISAFENWPQPIPAIRITNFTETGEGAMVCQ